MKKDEILKGIETFAENFAERRLRPYIERIRRPHVIGTSPKEVNDAIWGTIKLSPLEVVIIDSPIIQRLRLIRQLGVVHWVYPGATHSRFEHSLGVLHQAQQLISAINQAADRAAAPPIDGGKAALVRLCAVLHDIGHGVFSHVSEHALTRQVELRLALQSFAFEKGLPKIQLSELVAYHLVGSPAFREMMAVALDSLSSPIAVAGGSTANAARIVDLVQKAIIGHHIDEQVPLLHEIITGPFDADKLDYYARDARHAGVPSTLDISRLLQKLTTQRITSQNMPVDMLRGLSQQLETRDLFGLKWSGAAILDELHLSRVLLYAKIYRHKKVSAIEAMIEGLFDALSAHPDVDVVKLIALSFELCDDQLVVSNGEALLRMLKVTTEVPGITTFVDSTICRLRDRDLYISALAIVPKYPGDPWAEHESQKRGLDRLARDCKNEQTVKKLRAAISNELKSIFELAPEAISGIDPASLAYTIVISAKPPLGSGTEIDRALIWLGDRFVRGRELDPMNRAAWADANDVGKPHAIVFAPRGCSTAAYVAAERYLRREYEVVLPPGAIQMSKQNKSEVDALKRSLEAAGWYAKVPFDIRPIPERLLRQDVPLRVEKVANRLRAIDEPADVASGRRSTELPDRIVSWLAQFRDENSISCALTAIERMKILGREDNHAALRAFVAEHPEFSGATICPLGDIKDSGAIQAYLSLDSTRVFPLVSTLDEAVARGSPGPVVLLDDFTGSGSQAIDILANWFDQPELKQEQLSEQRLPFDAEHRKFLRSRLVAFVFIAGWKTGLEAIRLACKRLIPNATVFAHLTDDAIPFAFEGLLADQDQAAVEAFQEKAKKIGEALLASNGRDAAKQRERALGYGNRAMLLATRLNIPTQTLTCLWMDGKHDGVDWHALIRRRPKK